MYKTTESGLLLYTLQSDGSWYKQPSGGAINQDYTLESILFAGFTVYKSFSAINQTFDNASPITTGKTADIPDVYPQIQKTFKDVGSLDGMALNQADLKLIENGFIYNGKTNGGYLFFCFGQMESDSILEQKKGKYQCFCFGKFKIFEKIV